MEGSQSTASQSPTVSRWEGGIHSLRAITREQVSLPSVDLPKTSSPDSTYQAATQNQKYPLRRSTPSQSTVNTLGCAWLWLWRGGRPELLSVSVSAELTKHPDLSERLKDA